MSIVRLGEVSSSVMGQAPPGKACNKEGVGTPFVKAGEFDERFPAIREWTTQPLKHARLGDVLICVVGATAGKINQGIECAIGRSVAAIRPDVRRLDSNYLYYFMRQKTDAMRSKSQGLAQGVITRDMIADIEIPLPHMEEQRRIAAILDQADELRRKRQRVIDRLNQLRQALFHEMFGDFVTNPMGWSTVKLGDVCSVGSSKRVFVDEFVDEGVPFYRGTEVGKLATGDFIEPDLFIAPNHYADLITHSGKPEIGDLLLPSICHDGRIWRVNNEKPFYFKDGRVLWIKKNEAIFDSEYLRNHLRNGNRPIVTAC